MYKTIRQGENSLQYTILPQQDEGRSGPSVGHRRGGSAGPRQGGSSRKKSILAYIGLFFVCAIITFAILIPLMMTSDLMPTPTAWFYRNNQPKVRDFRNPSNLKLSVDGQRTEGHIVKGTPLRTATTTTAVTPTSVPPVPTTTQSTSTTKSTAQHSPLWSDALTVTEFQNLYKSDESMEQAQGMNIEDVLRPKTTTMSARIIGAINAASWPMSSTTASGPPGMSSSKNYPKHFSLQKHEKTLELPPAQESKPIHLDTDPEDMAKVHQNWLQAHWTYVDQWKVRASSLFISLLSPN